MRMVAITELVKRVKFPPIAGVKVVGVTGHARHGKDTFASALVRCVPGAMVIAFSDLIAAHERLSGRMEARDVHHLQASHFTIVRERLVLAMYHAILDRKPPLAVITGVRKPDEVEMIHSMGGQIVRIVRTDVAGGIFRSDDRDAAHEVEADIDSLAADEKVETYDMEALRFSARLYGQRFS